MNPPQTDRRSEGPRSQPTGFARSVVVIAWLSAAIPGCSSGETIPVGPGKPIAEAIARAKPGDVIVLPAGTFPGGIRLPAGVGLRGAGYRETTIEAGAADFGLSVEGGPGAEVTDLGIRGGTTGLIVKDTSGVAVRRVRVTDAINGIRFSGVEKGRVENAIIARNRYGIVVAGGHDDVVVNCTLADNSSLGLSLASGAGHAAFNNGMAGGSVGVFVGDVAGVWLDHNLYHTLFVGKSGDQVARRSLEDWKYLTGLDAHSVEIPLKFRDPKAGDYRPAGTLAWSLARASTTDWGASRLGGIEAPERDIDGQDRVGRFDLGAYEVTPRPSRAADGSLKAHSDVGIKSAGIFDPRGYEVAYLFHNLPLPAGDHPFWFPARDSVGRPIAAGTYEVRSVEADHRWSYLGWVGDTGEASPMGHTAPVSPGAIAFDDAGRLFVAQGWSEDATNIRCYGASTGKIDWTFSGSSLLNGFAFGSDGTLYFARTSESKKWDLTRIDPATGNMLPLGAKGATRVGLDIPMDVSGLAELGGKLYATDTRANKVRIGPSDGSRWEKAIDIPSPSSPAADRTTGVVWIISEGKRVLALGPDGQVVSERDFTGLAPAALAAGHGRLAIATAEEGVVRVLDLPDPKVKAKSGRTIGRGDGPYGPYLPDRFLFRKPAGKPPSHVALALGPKGELAVIDQNRVLVFDEKGGYVWGTFGLFGNNTAPSFSDPRRVYDTDGRRSLLLTVGPDGKGSWRPEGYYDLPVSGRLLGDFSLGEKAYGVIRADPSGSPFGDLVLVRYDGFRAVPVFAVIFDAKSGHYFYRKDANRDGKLDAGDGGEVVTGHDGKPYQGRLDHRFEILQPNGDLILCDIGPDQWGTIWHVSRDDDGTPAYRIGGREALPRPPAGLLSPYTHKLDPTNGFTWAEPDPRGGVTANISLSGTPDGTGLLNNAGTDIAGFDREGRVRWVRAFDRDRGLEGLGAVGPVVLTGVGTSAEIIVMDRDGLGLGAFSPPAEIHYPGFFLDHPPAVRAFRGPDGLTHALIADNLAGRHHWFRLEGVDRIKPSTASVILAPKAAAALAASPSPPAYVPTRPEQPVVRIPKLAGPLAMDGDPEKWRRAGIRPQIVVTPETSGGGIDGPRDCSAVVRLAYHGDDLYAQFLVFDDKVSFHQPVDRHYKQDGVEMCLNGFLTGFKFDATQTTDAGLVVMRNRFFYQKLDWTLPEGHAPRSMKVLDDARSLPERELIEGVYGIDLSGSRVIVIEFRLPIDAVTYKDSEKELKQIAPLGPGREFWLGFLINDNDDPGTDIQNYLVWPATYSNFGPAEDGARAILE